MTLAHLPSIPKIRAANIANHMSHRRRGAFSLAHHGGSGTPHRGPFAIAPHNRRPAILLPIQRIFEVGHGVDARIDAAFLIRIPFAIQNPSHSSLMCINLPLPLLFFCFSPQSLGDTFVPCDHLLIGFHWKTPSGQDLGERFARDWVFDVPLLHCFHHESRVLFRPKQELDGLPHHPTFDLQRRHSGFNKLDILPMRFTLIRWL